MNSKTKRYMTKIKYLAAILSAAMLCASGNTEAQNNKSKKYTTEHQVNIIIFLVADGTLA